MAPDAPSLLPRQHRSGVRGGGACGGTAHAGDDMNIAAVGAHPDDVELCGGGTLLRWAAETNHDVTVIVASDGARGGVGGAEVKALSQRRATEASEAAKMMGATLMGLGRPDGNLVDDDDLRAALVEGFRVANVDLVIGPPPDDYNADHVAVASAVEAACLWSCVPAFKSTSPPLARTPALWYFDAIGGRGEHPEVFVDITSVFEQKLTLLRLHASQAALTSRVLGVDLLDVAHRTNAFRGLQAGVAYAEGYRPSRRWPRIRDSSWYPWPSERA